MTIDTKNFWGTLDKRISAFVEHLSSISMIILFVIIFVMVVCRYVLRISVGGLAELPTYLFYINVWMAAVQNAKEKDGHIALDFIGIFVKNKKFRQAADVVLLIIAVGALGFFSYCAYLEVIHTFTRNSVTGGLKMPVWWLYSCVLFSAVMMTIYNLRRLSLAVKEVMKA